MGMTMQVSLTEMKPKYVRPWLVPVALRYAADLMDRGAPVWLALSCAAREVAPDGSPLHQIQPPFVDWAVYDALVGADPTVEIDDMTADFIRARAADAEAALYAEAS